MEAFLAVVVAIIETMVEAFAAIIQAAELFL